MLNCQVTEIFRLGFTRGRLFLSQCTTCILLRNHLNDKQMVSKGPFFGFGYCCSSELCGPGASCFNGCGVSNLTHTQSTLDIFPHFLLFLFFRTN